MPASTDFSGAYTVSDSSSFTAAKLSNRSVVVTGGASGIGEAVVRAFVAQHAFVTFSDLSVPRGEALAAELGASNVAFVPGNVNVWADQVALFKAAEAAAPSKGVDVVVANAGTGGSGGESILTGHTGSDGEPMEPDLMVLDTNLRAQQYTVSLAMHSFAKLPAAEGKDGCLVLVASSAGYADMPGGVQYQTSKFGMRGVMHSLRGVLPRFGARVNVIAPWWVRTRIIGDDLTKRLDANGTQWCEVEDVAAAVLHIASDPEINGRALGIVPRAMHPRGYLDMQEDDRRGAAGTEWEKIVAKLASNLSGLLG